MLSVVKLLASKTLHTPEWRQGGMGSDSRYYLANISLISYLLLTFSTNEYFLESQQVKNDRVMHFLVDLCLYRHPGLGYLAGPPHPYSRVHQMS